MEEMIIAIQNIYEETQSTFLAITGNMPEGIDLETAIEIILDEDIVDMCGADDYAIEQFKKLTHSQKKIIAFKALKGYFK